MKFNAEVKIEEIKKGDQEEAHQFCLSIFDELGWDKRFTYGLDNLKDFFDNPREIFLVAKEKDRIISCAGLKELSETEGLVKRFYVSKDFRGKGLAVLMLEKLEKFAREKNYKTIVLDIYPNNERAKKFFKRYGFSAFKPAAQDNWPESKHPEIFEFRKLDLD